MVGASRKTFIGNVCGKKQPLPVSERLEGSLAAASIAVINGANIIRVHDVKETRRCIDLADCVIKNR
jgi:dihydropteroate synthase